MIPHDVFSYPKLLGNLPVRQPFGDQLGNFMLSLREHAPRPGADHPQGLRAHQSLQDKMELVAGGPDLSFVHHLNAFA